MLQRFALDPLLAALLFASAIACARGLLFVFDRLGDRSGSNVLLFEVSPVHKFASLEALRGVLALAVVAHHACCWYFLVQTGAWSTGNSIVFSRLASFGVAQFFYLSGFLFWRKLIMTAGISTTIRSSGRFYLSRFVRIAPVYYVCLAAAILLGLAATGFRLGGQAQTLLPFLPWLLFSLGGQPDLLCVSIARITGGVSWTLALECLFYLSLPWLKWFSRHPRRLIYFAAAFLALHFVAVHLAGVPWAGRKLAAVQFAHPGPLNSPGLILGAYAKFMLIGFGGGILIAAFEKQIRNVPQPSLRLQNCVLLALYAGYLLIPGITGPGQFLLLAGFALILHGADLFGLLHCRPIRLLGVISYPIYLIHGWVYYAVFHLLDANRPIPFLPLLALNAACLALLLLLAILVHLSIERPALRLSERIARKPPECSSHRS